MNAYQIVDYKILKISLLKLVNHVMNHALLVMVIQIMIVFHVIQLYSLKIINVLMNVV